LKLTKRYVALPIVVILTTLSLYASAQTINTVSGINFGAYDFATTFNVRIQLGTDGNASLTGSGASFQGGEAAGHIRITSPDTGIIEIKCTTTAQLFDPTATTLTIENIEISVNTGAPFGDGNACNGLGGGDATAATIDMDALPDPDVFIGGEITLSSPITLPADHSYSTTGSGTPIMLSIVIQ
tara:strand:+ start:2006 stop:2557 length:552 start_codon:yes stop_codon:yes gene_type:complete